MNLPYLVRLQTARYTPMNFRHDIAYVCIVNNLM